jgi:hypothetical protein
VLVYCFVHEMGREPGRSTHRDQVGPVSISVRFSGQRQLEAKAIVERLSADSSGKAKLLYVKPIAIDRVGQYHVSVRDGEGRPVSVATVQGTDAAFHPWMPLVRSDKRRSRVDQQTRNDPPTAFLGNRAAGIALPRWDGMLPIVFEGDTGRGIVKRLRHARLPTLVPRDVDSGLKVDVDGRNLSITSDTDISTYRADWHLLARWWVNGEPFIPAQVAEFPGDENGRITRGRRLRVALDFDPRRLDAKRGDRIGLQLLYCPHGWEWVTSGVEMLRAVPMQEDFHDISRLSNRVEFVAP